MRLSPASAAILVTGALVLTGCGSDDGDVARTTAGATPTATEGAVVTSTQAAPAGTVVVPPPTTVTTPTEGSDDGSGGTSGGTIPPATTTVTVQQPPTVDGDRPSVERRSDGTARATAVDEGQAQIWCDAARQGSYDDLLGDATTFVIAVRGSDSVTRCQLPG